MTTETASEKEQSFISDLQKAFGLGYKIDYINSYKSNGVWSELLVEMSRKLKGSGERVELNWSLESANDDFYKEVAKITNFESVYKKPLGE